MVCRSRTAASVEACRATDRPRHPQSSSADPCRGRPNELSMNAAPRSQLPLERQQGAGLIHATQNALTQPTFKQADHGLTTNASDGHGASPEQGSMDRHSVVQWLSHCVSEAVPRTTRQLPYQTGRLLAKAGDTAAARRVVDSPTLGLLTGLGPLPNESTVHLDAAYDSAKFHREGTDPRKPALARGTYPCLAERLPPARSTSCVA